MTGHEPIRPFELDPATLAPDRVQLVEPEPHHPLPVALGPEVAETAPRRPWRRLLFGAGGALLAGLLGIEAYDLASGLFVRSSILGWGFTVLLGGTLVGALGAGAHAVWSLGRLARLERLRARATPLLASDAHGRAEPLLDEIARAYEDRPELAAAVARFRREADDALSDGERLTLFGHRVLAPLDRRAQRLVLRAARDIGVLTALSPLGLLDGAIVLARTLAMLRAIARVYGVRPGHGTTGRLLRRSLANVLAAGVGELVADAAVETAGASLLAVLSAKAGQGVVNGVLAARLGLAAMQLCRPLPFTPEELPTIRQLRAQLLAATPSTPAERGGDPG
jgi:putative membrane protein